MIAETIIIVLTTLAVTYFSTIEKTIIFLKRNNIREDHRSAQLSAIMIARYSSEIILITICILIYNISISSRGILILCVLVILTTEVIPYYLSVNFSGRLIQYSKGINQFFTLLFYPITKLFNLNFEPILQENLNHENLKSLFTHNDIELLLPKGYQTRFMDKDESNMLKNIVELGDRRIYEAIRPRTEIIGVEINSSIDEVIDVFIQSGYSKIPVYEESLDNIKGIVLANDLFHNPATLSEILREVIFVPETKRCADMLKEFSDKRISFAVAVDEFGGTAGILTTEDILEELFGEIKDEYDTDDVLCKEIADNIYIIGGKVEVDYINETLKLNIPKGGYSTIGGFIISHTGKIPAKGDTIIIDSFKIVILRSNQIRIELVKIILQQGK